MNYEEFKASLGAGKPPEKISAYLSALWFDARSDWQKAHEIAQDIDDPQGSWIHAYLHRKEGDTANAGYWYRKAGKQMPSVPLDKEWEDMVKAFL
jgi:hypothetical protein